MDSNQNVETGNPNQTRNLNDETLVVPHASFIRISGVVLRHFRQTPLAAYASVASSTGSG
jgi:hypothetical protein